MSVPFGADDAATQKNLEVLANELAKQIKALFITDSVDVA